MTIALIHDKASAALTQVLSLLGTVAVFADQFRLRDYLLAKNPCDLVVSAADGALGMNVCITAREQGLPILWLTEQPDFAPQSRRIPVDVFLVKPVEPSVVFAAAERLLLRPPVSPTTSSPGNGRVEIESKNQEEFI